MAKASESQLGDLHGVVAEGLTTVIRDGVVLGLDGEGNPVKATASPAFFAAAIALLKNNNVTADPNTNSRLTDLQAKLQANRKQGKGKLTRSDLDALEAMGQEELRDMGAPLQ